MRYFLAQLHSPLTRAALLDIDGETLKVDLYHGDNELALTQRVNKLLDLEARLWAEARQGGYTGTVPYPVRYESARHLWSANIVGVAFCLRCGTLIRHQRKGRTHGTKKKPSPSARPVHTANGYRTP
jgi:hypothetical protein